MSSFAARNRFNLRGSSTTTTERSTGDEESADAGSAAEATPSTTARSTLRSRPALNLRGRSRTTTTRAPAADDAAAEEASSSDEGKAAPAAAPAAAAEPVRPSRFNLHRAGGNRLLPRGKLGRAGVSTEAPKEAAEDSAADSSHHNDVKGSETEAGEAGGEKTEESDAAAGNAANHAGPVSGINRLKTRPRLNALHKTDAAAKPRPAAANTAAATGGAAAAAPATGRKVNPLLAKRRLHLGGAAAATSTTGECSPLLLPTVA